MVKPWAGHSFSQTTDECAIALKESTNVKNSLGFSRIRSTDFLSSTILQPGLGPPGPGTWISRIFKFGNLYVVVRLHEVCALPYWTEPPRVTFGPQYSSFGNWAGVPDGSICASLSQEEFEYFASKYIQRCSGTPLPTEKLDPKKNWKKN